jgi:hypothetical protein
VYSEGSPYKYIHLCTIESSRPQLLSGHTLYGVCTHVSTQRTVYYYTGPVSADANRRLLIPKTISAPCAKYCTSVDEQRVGETVRSKARTVNANCYIFSDVILLC